MGRSYQGEPWVQEYFDSLLQRKVLAEIGLLLGKEAVGARDLILGVVPTPQQEGQEPFQLSLGSAPPSNKGGKKPTGQASASVGPASVTSLALNSDWIGQHAEQVSRMLPGGLCLLGVYVFCSDAGYQSTTTPLWSTLQQLQDIRSAHAINPTGQELAILHADSTSRKVTLRSLVVSPGTSPAAPSVAEIKWAPCVTNLARIQCNWRLDCDLPAASSTSSLQEQVERIVDKECCVIRGAVACLESQTIPTPEALLVDALILTPTPALGGGPTPLPIGSVHLLPLQGLVSPADGAAGAGLSAGVVGGLGQLSGWLSGVAVVHKRQAWASVVQELKSDLCRSLHVRLEILVEDALSWQEEQQEEAAGKEDEGATTSAPPEHPLLTQDKPLVRPYAVGLPRRVLLTAKGGLPICDYLLPGEGVGVAAGRALDMLRNALDEGDAEKLEEQVIILESEAGVPKKLSTWTPGVVVVGTKVDQSSAKGVKGGASSAACSTTLMGGAAAGAAVVVAAVAVLLSNMTT